MFWFNRLSVNTVFLFRKETLVKIDFLLLFNIFLLFQLLQYLRVFNILFMAKIAWITGFIILLLSGLIAVSELGGGNYNICRCKHNFFSYAKIIHFPPVGKGNYSLTICRQK